MRRWFLSSWGRRPRSAQRPLFVCRGFVSVDEFKDAALNQYHIQFNGGGTATVSASQVVRKIKQADNAASGSREAEKNGHFEAFKWTGKSLGAMGSPFGAKWGGATALMSHPTAMKDMWYSNSKDFIKEIPGFTKNAKYAMRWTGRFYAAKPGRYTFQTRSDDGSRLYINRRLVVNNDGNHGMRNRQGTVDLPHVGSYNCMVTFYENGGGAGLEVRYKPPGLQVKILRGGMYKSASGNYRCVRI